MDPFLVPSQLKTAITPGDIIHLNKSVPYWMVLLGTLGSIHTEVTAARFVVHSQEAGKWVGFAYDSKADADISFATMVEQGFLSEVDTGEGWHYELSQFAIEQIYVSQAKRQINQLSQALRKANAPGFWRRTWKNLSGVPGL